jgi:adenosylhomocysteine nucleosidase
MKILMVYALEEERGDIKINGHDIYWCRTGFGKIDSALNTCKSITEVKPDLVINFGSSGALDHKIGEILFCTRFIDREMKRVLIPGIKSEISFSDEIKQLGILENYNIDNTVSTGDSFVTRPEDAGPAANVIDMEAYAIAYTCKEAGIPFFSVKYVTDIVGQNSVKAWTDKLEETKTELEAFFNNLEL